MKISHWKVLFFVVIIIIGTIMLFPGEKSVVPYYVKAGEGLEARRMLNDLLAKRPGDPRLLLMSADAYQAEGMPDLAAQELQKGLKKDPNNPVFNSRLADHYDALRDPEQAAQTWEKVYKMDEKNEKAAGKLIDLYRYRGETVKEAAAIVKLIKSEAEAEKKKNKKKSVLSNMIAAQILNFNPDKPSDSTTTNQKAAIVSNLYVEMSGYQGAVDEGADNRQTREALLYSCLEILVAGRSIAEARKFASSADASLGMGRFGRIKLAEFLHYYGEGEYALAVVQEVITEYPKDPDLWRFAGELALELKNYNTAIANYGKLLALAPKDKDARIKLAEALLGNGDIPGAFAVYAELEGQKPGADPSAVKKKAVMLVLKGAQATGNARTMDNAMSWAMERLPNDPDVTLASGDFYLAANRPGLAYLAYRKLALMRRDRAIVKRMMETAGFANRPDYIMESALLARRLFPRDTELIRQVAELYVAQGKLKEATSAYRSYLAIKKNDVKVMMRLAELYGWMDDPKSAYKVISPLVQKTDTDKTLLIKAAGLAEAAGMDIDAFNLYARLHHLSPGDLTVRNQMARLAAQIGRPLVAAKYLAAISDEDRSNYQKAMEAGNAYSGADRLKRGLTYFERALSIAPDNLDLRRKLAQYYSWTGMRKKQIAMLESLEEKGQLNREEKVALAEYALARKDGGRALKLIRFVETEKKLPQREGMILAEAYTLSRNEDSSLRTFRRLARENDRDPQLLASLGNSALALKRTDTALEFFEASLRLDPRNTDALKGSAQIYAWNNDAKRAMAGFERHNSLNARDIEARYQLGELYQVNDRKGQAAQEYKKSLELIRKARQAAKLKRAAEPVSEGGRNE